MDLSPLPPAPVPAVRGESGPARVPLVLAVTGGRTYDDDSAAAHVALSLVRAHDRGPVGLLVHGDCRDALTNAPCGADALAAAWAQLAGVPVKAFPADWDRLGRQAGPIRNSAMVAFLLAAKLAGYRIGAVAFPGGSGTRDCSRKLEAARVPLWVPPPFRLPAVGAATAPAAA